MRTALLLLATAGLAGVPWPPTMTVVSTRGERRVMVTRDRGFPAVSAAELSTVLSIEREPAPPGAATLRVLGRQFDFVLEAGYFRFEGRIYTLASGPYVARDTLFLPLQWAADYLPRLFAARFRYDPVAARLEELPAPAPAASAAPVERPGRAGPARPRRRVVAIDAGHGGIDPGMTGPLGTTRFLREKEVTLAVARYLEEELGRRGFGTVLTRDRDTLIHRRDRGAIAARAGADIFVSIHVNDANPRWRNASAARGFETYFLGEALTEDERRVSRMEESVVRFETSASAEPGEPMSRIVADMAQNEHLRESSRLALLVQRSLGRVHPAANRGVKQAAFTVLHTSYMPAILVETGFGSNLEEARYLMSASGRRAIARAVADGVASYLAEYERRVAGQ